MDVVHKIEKVRTRSDRPIEPVQIEEGHRHHGVTDDDS